MTRRLAVVHGSRADSAVGVGSVSVVLMKGWLASNNRLTSHGEEGQGIERERERRRHANRVNSLNRMYVYGRRRTSCARGVGGRKQPNISRIR